MLNWNSRLTSYPPCEAEAPDGAEEERDGYGNIRFYRDFPFESAVLETVSPLLRRRSYWMGGFGRRAVPGSITKVWSSEYHSPLTSPFTPGAGAAPS